MHMDIDYIGRAVLCFGRAELGKNRKTFFGCRKIRTSGQVVADRAGVFGLRVSAAPDKARHSTGKGRDNQSERYDCDGVTLLLGASRNRSEDN